MVELRPNKRWLFLLFLVVGIISVPIFYLNCSGPVPGSSNLASVDQNIDSGGIFAYEIDGTHPIIDTLAYMSCGDLTSGNFDPTTFWNFKVGAYNQNSGVALSNAFTYAVRNLSPNDQVSALQNSQLNGNLYPDLSIRQAGKLAGNYSISNVFDTSGPGTDNGQYANYNLDDANSFLSTFNQQLFSGTNNDWHNTNYPSNYTIPISGILSYPGQEYNGNVLVPDSVQNAVRADVAQGGPDYLVTEYAFGDGINSQGVPYNSSNGNTYGYGYRFDFGYGPFLSGGAAKAIVGPTKISTGVTEGGVFEYNLETGKPTGAQWTCANLEIIYPADVGSNLKLPNCSGTSLPTGALGAAIANVLPGWRDDGLCVEPPATTSGSEFCEGTLPMAASGPSQTNYTGTCNPSVAGSCPEMVSVCVRN